LDARLIDGNAPRGKIADDVLDLLVVAAAMEAERREIVGVGLGLRPRQADPLRRPQTQQLAPARAHLEGQLLIVLPLALEGFLAIVEAHAVPHIPLGPQSGVSYRSPRGGLCAR